MRTVCQTGCAKITLRIKGEDERTRYAHTRLSEREGEYIKKTYHQCSQSRLSAWKASLCAFCLSNYLLIAARFEMRNNASDDNAAVIDTVLVTLLRKFGFYRLWLMEGCV